MDLTLFYELTLKNVMYILGQMLIPDMRAWVFGGPTAFRDEWFEGKGKEGTQNSPPPYWGPSSSYNRVILLDVFLKVSREHMLTLDYAKLTDRTGREGNS